MTHFDHFANEMGGFDYLNIVGLSLTNLTLYDSDYVLSPRGKSQYNKMINITCQFLPCTHQCQNTEDVPLVPAILSYNCI